jgi:hypothetical protein
MVNRADRDASGHRDGRDGCHHLMGCGEGQPLITHWCQLPCE